MSAPKCICWKPTAPHQPDCPMGKPVKIFWGHDHIARVRPLGRGRLVHDDRGVTLELVPPQ